MQKDIHRATRKTTWRYDFGRRKSHRCFTALGGRLLGSRHFSHNWSSSTNNPESPESCGREMREVNERANSRAAGQRRAMRRIVGLRWDEGKDQNEKGQR